LSDQASAVTSVKRRGLLLILSSPSGAGKSTIARALLESDDNLSMSVSATTRAPRPGEVDGQHYHFVTHQRFDEMIENGEFLEHATVFENKYGTPSAPVNAALEEGKDVLFDVDWQGAQEIEQNAPDDLVSVFILPPSIEELERRLFNRAQDSEEVVRARMAKATSEMSHWSEYQYVVVNRELDESVANVAAILRAERLRRRRQSGLIDLVRSMGVGQ